VNIEPDENLDRLLAGASQAESQDEPEPMPERLRKRVLANWRASLAEQVQGKLHAAFLALMFRRALLCAALLMSASVVVCVMSDPDDDDEIDVSASVLQSDTNEVFPNDAAPVDVTP
jgi:hypothetical protein